MISHTIWLREEEKDPSFVAMIRRIGIDTFILAELSRELDLPWEKCAQSVKEQRKKHPYKPPRKIMLKARRALILQKEKEDGLENKKI